MKKFNWTPPDNVCGRCNGDGEGLYLGTICKACKGTKKTIDSIT